MTCEELQLKPKVSRTGRVTLDGQLLGHVWRTTSFAVWGSLSCTPHAKVFAWRRAGTTRPQGSAGIQRDAVRQLVKAVDLVALGFSAEQAAEARTW